MKNKSIWIVGIIIILTFGIMYAYRDRGSNVTDYPLPPDAPGPSELVANDWTRGNPDSKVTLLEYSDFQCPACGWYHTPLSQLLQDYANDFLFVYRHFPLNIHKNAHLAARVTEAAGLQGKFWEMHNLLFERQSEGSEREALPIFVNYADELGLDITKFKQDIDSEAVIARVQRDVASGNGANIPGTPTFFLNGEKIANPQSLEEFKAVIDKALGR